MFASLPLRARGDAEADLLSVALDVELQEARQDFVAEVRWPEQAALVGVVVLVRLVEEDRLGSAAKVVPAISFERGAIHGGVQLAQALDVLGRLAGVVEAIVGLGQALVAGNHERGTVVDISLPGGFECGVDQEAGGQWERLETVRRRIAQIILHRRREEPSPDLMSS